MRYARLNSRLTTLAAVLAGLVLAACPQPARETAGRGAQVTAAPDALTLAYLGDLRGFQRPCG